MDDKIVQNNFLNELKIKILKLNEKKETMSIINKKC